MSLFSILGHSWADGLLSAVIAMLAWVRGRFVRGVARWGLTDWQLHDKRYARADVLRDWPAPADRRCGSAMTVEAHVDEAVRRAAILRSLLDRLCESAAACRTRLHPRALVYRLFPIWFCCTPLSRQIQA